MGLYSAYERWLHGSWPAGETEPFPVSDSDGRTNVPGVYVVGDLTGVPLLKFALDSGAAVITNILDEPSFQSRIEDEDTVDVVIVGAGVSGVSAAAEADARGLRYTLYEGAQAFNTLHGFPARKPIFTYPSEMTPRGQLAVSATKKEALIDELDRQLEERLIDTTQGRVTHVAPQGKRIAVTLEDEREVYAHRVILAVGRSGEYRRLGVPGEDFPEVYPRLHDASPYRDRRALVVGGGDSAVEAAIALTLAGADTTLIHRGSELTRPKAQNMARLEALQEDRHERVSIEAPSSTMVTTTATPLESEDQPRGHLHVISEAEVSEIQEEQVLLTTPQGPLTLSNDVVFTMIGRQPPLELFRRSGISILGEWSTRAWCGLVAALAFALWLYHWKSYSWFPLEALNPSGWIATLRESLGESSHDKSSALYTLLRSAQGPSFYYTLVYSTLIGVFGYRRIKRRNTPYVTWQTLSLMVVQWVPLFLLPELILPWMGRNDFFIQGAYLRPAADLFFESYDGGIGVERAYWRSYGFILAWPLMVYNWFTSQPMLGWLALGAIQTFVIIPLMIRRWGKGAYCGWICSCGALAETLGDTQRHKMPHGRAYNRLNMLGQFVLAAAVVLMALRIVGWVWPGGTVDQSFGTWIQGDSPLTYKWIVDVMLGGVLGVGLYFHFSGRTWCRFACPLAALMNIYTRLFSRFRIFADKAKCISCGQCTRVCHQGIDVMAFANKGRPMEDPQCVRCSACVQACPTGVLQFGRLDANGEAIPDRLSASPVLRTESAGARRLPVIR